MPRPPMDKCDTHDFKERPVGKHPGLAAPYGSGNANHNSAWIRGYEPEFSLNAGTDIYKNFAPSTAPRWDTSELHHRSLAADTQQRRPRADDARSPNYIVGYPTPRSPAFPTVAEANRRRAARIRRMIHGGLVIGALILVAAYATIRTS